MPAKIALVGAPGVGKTHLARNMKKDHGFAVVDNIPQKISKKYDLAIGWPADYRTDLLILADRLVYALEPPKEDTVYTTTLLDSLAYAILRDEANNSNDPGKLFQTVANVSVIMDCFMDTFDFDKVIHLASDPDEDSLAGAIETNIRAILAEVGENIDIETIPGKPTRRRAAKVPQGS